MSRLSIIVYIPLPVTEVPSPSSSCTTTHAALHESLLSILARLAHRLLTDASHAHEPAALRLSTALARVP